MPRNAPVPTIVITVDGLRAAALGAYGQTAYETPGFDAFAAEGRTFEWAYARTPSAAEFFAATAGEVASLGLATTLVTDDPETSRPLARVALRTETIPAASTSAARSIAESPAARLWERFAAATVDAFEGADLGLVWLHTRGLYGPWTAPPELIDSLRDEEDPCIEASTIPPDAENGDDDDRFAAACRYAAEVMTLDACFAGWLDVVRGATEGCDVRVLLAGVRGFPLGEHRRIGRVDERLFSEQQHAPLVVCDATPESRFDRDATPRLLESALAGLLGRPDPPDEPLVLSSPAAQAVLTRDWLLRRPLLRGAEAELYVKPDDRWEQNNIAVLREGVVAELSALLPPHPAC